MQNKRGQAAMEFLMTYGWAILAAIIAIGVLAYFGVFSPGQFAPSAAIVNPPFYANGWDVTGSAAGDDVSLELQNNGGETLTLTSVAINSATVAGTGVICVSDTSFAAPVTAGNLIVATLNCGDLTGNSGDTFKGNIVISYTKAGSSLTLTSTGTITDTIN